MLSPSPALSLSPCTSDPITAIARASLSNLIPTPGVLPSSSQTPSLTALPSSSQTPSSTGTPVTYLLSAAPPPPPSIGGTCLFVTSPKHSSLDVHCAIVANGQRAIQCAVSIAARSACGVLRSNNNDIWIVQVAGPDTISGYARSTAPGEYSFDVLLNRNGTYSIQASLSATNVNITGPDNLAPFQCFELFSPNSIAEGAPRTFTVQGTAPPRQAQQPLCASLDDFQKGRYAERLACAECDDSLKNLQANFQAWSVHWVGETCRVPTYSPSQARAALDRKWIAIVGDSTMQELLALWESYLGIQFDVERYSIPPFPYDDEHHRQRQHDTGWVRVVDRLAGNKTTLHRFTMNWSGGPSPAVDWVGLATFDDAEFRSFLNASLTGHPKRSGPGPLPPAPPGFPEQEGVNGTFVTDFSSLNLPERPDEIFFTSCAHDLGARYINIENEGFDSYGRRLHGALAFLKQLGKRVTMRGCNIKTNEYDCGRQMIGSTSWMPISNAVGHYFDELARSVTRAEGVRFIDYAPLSFSRSADVSANHCTNPFTWVGAHVLCFTMLQTLIFGSAS